MMFSIDSKGALTLKDPALLLIREFKAIWSRDKSKDKSEALKELSYVYFKCDFGSPYRQNTSPDELPSKLKKELEMPKDWKEDKVIKAAEAKYNDLKISKSMRALMAAESALDQIIDYFDSIDILTLPDDKRDAAAEKLMKNVGNIDETISKLETAKRRVEKETNEQNLTGSKILTSRELPPSQR